MGFIRWSIHYTISLLGLFEEIRGRGRRKISGRRASLGQGCRGESLLSLNDEIKHKLRIVQPMMRLYDKKVTA